MRVPRFLRYWLVSRRFDRKSQFTRGGVVPARPPAASPRVPSAPRGVPLAHAASGGQCENAAAAQGLVPADASPLSSAGTPIAEPGLERLARLEELEHVVSGDRARYRSWPVPLYVGSGDALGAPDQSSHSPARLMRDGSGVPT
jgi:hypothetical protein